VCKDGWIQEGDGKPSCARGSAHTHAQVLKRAHMCVCVCVTPSVMGELLPEAEGSLSGQATT